MTERKMEVTDHKEEHQETFNHHIWLTQPPSWNHKVECLTELTQIYLFYNRNSATQPSATQIRRTSRRSGTKSGRTNGQETLNSETLGRSKCQLGVTCCTVILAIRCPYPWAFSFHSQTTVNFAHCMTVHPCVGPAMKKALGKTVQSFELTRQHYTSFKRYRCP